MAGLLGNAEGGADLGSGLTGDIVELPCDLRGKGEESFGGCSMTMGR
jgi:hypothetical protein